MKLTTKQIAALRDIDRSQGKSGDYWRRCGYSHVTLGSLERHGLAAGCASSVFQTTGLRQTWFITPAGRAALADGGSDEQR